MFADSLILGPLLIFVLRLIDVSLGTVRIIFVFRGKRIQAAIIGFIEIVIFVYALGTVVTNLDNIPNILAYSLGFAGGTLLGSMIEEKMAIGFMTVQVIPSGSSSHEIAGILREEGFGVTSFDAWGRDGAKIVLLIHLFRKDWGKLQEILENHDQSAFITVMDTRSTKGGYLKLLKKR